MTPEETKLIAHIIKIIACSTNNEIEARKKLIDLAGDAGIELSTKVRFNHPAPIPPPTVDDTPCVQHTIKRMLKDGMEVPDLYVECVVEKGDSVYTMLESAFAISRPVNLNNVVVLEKRYAVGRDDVEVFALQIGEMSIQKVKEDKDANDKQNNES